VIFCECQGFIDARSARKAAGSGLPDWRFRPGIRQGDETVLEDVLGDHLSQQQQLSLALAYFDHGDVDVDAGVRRGMIERLSDAEDGPKHQEPGLRH